MKNVPEKIYLQLGYERELNDDFNKCREVSWCADKINDSDIEYVLQSQSGEQKWTDEDVLGWLTKYEEYRLENAANQETSCSLKDYIKARVTAKLPNNKR